MSRLSTVFIATCMVLIAASLGVVAAAGFGLRMAEAAGIAVAALAAQILVNAIASRLPGNDSQSQMGHLSRGIADLGLQMADFGRRLAAVEGKVASAQSVGKNRIASVRGEIGELGSLLRQLAGSVADHDDLLNARRVVPSRPARPTIVPQISDIKPAGAPLAIGTPATLPVQAPLPQPPGELLIETVRGAVESGRIDIYLQPTVSLPQRKVRFYEALSRLRDDEDRVLAAEEFIAAAEHSKLIGRIDHAAIQRSMQVLRRLMIRNDDVGVFCNLSAATVSDAETFAPCLEFLEANRSMAGSFVLEFRQATLRDLDAAARDRLASLSRIGYRFSLDHVTDLRFDPRELAALGVRYVKVAAAMLLQPRDAQSPPGELSDLLGRFGIELIAERIESEPTVAGLMNYDVRFGQGFAFSPPRPLRPDGPANAAPELASPAPSAASKPAARDPSAPIPFQPRAEPSRAAANSAPGRRALGPV